MMLCRDIRTLENCESSASAGCIPRLPHIFDVRSGHEVPEKIRVARILNSLKIWVWQMLQGQTAKREMYIY